MQKQWIRCIKVHGDYAEKQSGQYCRVAFVYILGRKLRILQSVLDYGRRNEAASAAVD